MDRRRRHGRRLARLVAVTVAATAMVVPASVAGATGGNGGASRGNDGIDHGHGIKVWKGKGHGQWHRPPSGTVGAPVATGLNAPFGIDVDRFGRVYVAETGIGDENAVAPGQVSRFHKGKKTVLATNAPFVSDVDAGWWGDFAYTVGAPTSAVVSTWPGRPDVTSDLGVYEATNNPDQVNTYGPQVDLEALAGPACWATVPPDVAQVAAPYTGLVDSNPFRTIRLPDGSRAVADSAANAILRVKRNGEISTLAVLPPNLANLSKEFLSGPLTENGETLPQCVLDVVPADGIAYAFEPVPTGLAIGPDGHLYVGFLPGGEVPGAAKVVRINLRTKQVSDFVTGFTTITDIVFSRNGTLYLTELFSGNVVKVPTRWSHHGLVARTPSVLASVPLPNGLAIGPTGTVYASINSLTPAGEVVPITP